MRRLTQQLLILGALPLLLLSGLWLWWSETHPEQERELRVAAQEKLVEWFPEAMAPPELFGFQVPEASSRSVPDVLLLHGLDEPGGIWDATLQAMGEAGLEAWEFHYPNDQAIDHSADLLAEHWPRLGDDGTVILVGHSMGGLVIRDFITRWRHPVDQASQLGGPQVLGVIMIGTPNQGSGWARLRAWLELREWLARIPDGDLSPIAGLRQGTGAAKVDLRPDSRFLDELNAREWLVEVHLKIIGGLLADTAPEIPQQLDRLAGTFAINDLPERVEAWWADTGEGLGDGVVPLASLGFDGAPEPLVLQASHRGLLVDVPLAEGPPPAIAPMLETVQGWLAEHELARSQRRPQAAGGSRQDR